MSMVGLRVGFWRCLVVREEGSVGEGRWAIKSGEESKGIAVL